jgi:hypothetical protein
MVVVMNPKSKSPPVGVTPPWIIIVVRIGTVIVFRPKIVLSVQEEGISVIHFTEGFDLLSLNFACDGDLFPSLEDI